MLGTPIVCGLVGDRSARRGGGLAPAPARARARRADDRARPGADRADALRERAAARGQPPRGAHRFADRPRQPAQAPRSISTRSSSARSDGEPRMLASSTSTASRRTTTRSAIPPGTRCWRASRRSSWRRRARRAARTAWAVTSSACCCRRPSPRCSGSPNALNESGEGFAVTSAYGAALLPDDAATVSAALSVADQRLYAHKELLAEIRRGTAHEPLLRTLAEREPELRAHVADVSSLALRVGRAARTRARRARGAAARRRAARRRQARDPGRRAAEVRAARRDRVGLHPLAHADRPADPRAAPALRLVGDDRPLDPRELGRHRLSRQASPARRFRSRPGSSSSATRTPR